jgi:hypothetical protein
MLYVYWNVLDKVLFIVYMWYIYSHSMELTYSKTKAYEKMRPKKTPNRWKPHKFLTAFRSDGRRSPNTAILYPQGAKADHRLPTANFRGGWMHARSLSCQVSRNRGAGIAACRGERKGWSAASSTHEPLLLDPNPLLSWHASLASANAASQADACTTTWLRCTYIHVYMEYTIFTGFCKTVILKVIWRAFFTCIKLLCIEAMYRDV